MVTMAEPSMAMVVRDDDLDLAPLKPIFTKDEAKHRLAEIREFVNDVMEEEVHYGTIPGSDKKTLFKPGAEFLCEIYGLVPRFDILESIKRFTDPPFFFYEVRCTLEKNGKKKGEGIGSYASGTEMALDKRFITFKGRQPVALIGNTTLKMALKSAHIAATLTATQSSGLLTQDLEDSLDGDPMAPRAGMQGGTERPTCSHGRPMRPDPKVGWKGNHPIVQNPQKNNPKHWCNETKNPAPVEDAVKVTEGGTLDLPNREIQVGEFMHYWSQTGLKRADMIDLMQLEAVPDNVGAKAMAGIVEKWLKEEKDRSLNDVLIQATAVAEARYAQLVGAQVAAEPASEPSEPAPEPAPATVEGTFTEIPDDDDEIEGLPFP